MYLRGLKHLPLVEVDLTPGEIWRNHRSPPCFCVRQRYASFKAEEFEKREIFELRSPQRIQLLAIGALHCGPFFWLMSWLEEGGPTNKTTRLFDKCRTRLLGWMEIWVKHGKAIFNNYWNWMMLWIPQVCWHGTKTWVHMMPVKSSSWTGVFSVFISIPVMRWCDWPHHPTAMAPLTLWCSSNLVMLQ